MIEYVQAIQLTFLNCKQVYLAYESVDTGAEVALHLE